MDSLLPSMTLECLLGNEPDPDTQFVFDIVRIPLNYSTAVYQILGSDDGVLQLNKTALLPLFNMDTESIIVTCRVYNYIGTARMETIITICGTHTFSLKDPSV